VRGIPFGALLGVPLTYSTGTLLSAAVQPLSIVLVAAVVLAAICAAAILPSAIAGFNSINRRLLRKQRVLNSEEGIFWLRDLLRNGLPVFRIPSRLMLGFMPWRQVSMEVEQCLSSKSFTCSNEAVSELLLAVSLLSGMSILIAVRTASSALITAVIVPVLIGSRVKTINGKRLQLMREQLPDALQCLSFCFLTGCSLVQAIEQTADEVVDPLGQELKLVRDDMHSGIGIQQALSSFEQRNNLAEISFISVALEIQHQTGGSLRDTLETAAASVRTSVALKRQLQVQTAQARLSYKVVAMMPVFLVLVLSLTVKGYAATFFSSVEGLALLLTALVMELTGILMIRRILGVDVG